MPVPEDRSDTLPTIPNLLQLANQLEQAWHDVPAELPPPKLSDYLPPTSDPLRSRILRELVRVDLEMRWRRGLPAYLESYTKQYPELGEDNALPAELILHEYRVRRQHGDRPNISVYRERFPAQYRRLLELAQQGSRLSHAADSKAKPPASKSASAEKKPGTPEAEKPTAAEHDTDQIDVKTFLSAQASARKSGEILVPPAASDSRSDSDAPVVPMEGGYRLLKRLGSGALGEVWKAEAPGGVEVAVKRLSRTLDSEEAKHELQSLEHVKQLRHPYLAQIHAFWIHKGRLHIVMELADGSLLDRQAHYRKQGQPGIPREELIRYMHEAAEALDFLHASGVHHRDIKPANILLLKGYVKVADFGLARPLHGEQSVIEATFCGTPAYMGPEVWENKFSTHSDQWSLAVTYVELRLNRRVFKNRSLQGLMQEIREGKFDLSPLGKAERRVLRRALHFNPRQRYPTCSAFVQDLEAVFQPPPPAPRRRNRLVLALLLLAGLVVGGLLVSLIGRFFPTPQVATASPPRILLEQPQEVTLSQGQSRSLQVKVHRESYHGQVWLLADAEQARENRIAIETTSPPESVGDDVLVTLKVQAEPNAVPGTHRIKLQMAKGLPESETFLPLTILYLPPEFAADGKVSKPDAQGVKYHTILRWHPNTAEEITFLLIPQENQKDDLPTYYIARDKITREQFRYFVNQHAGKVVARRWGDHPDDDPRMPVRDVFVEEAHAFAQSLGGLGLLPTIRQWDKAAGLHHPNSGKEPNLEGPYKGRWSDNPRPKIAVGYLRRPLRVGEAQDDVSPYGCRDMAGNGFEWTRNFFKTNRKFVPHDPGWVEPPDDPVSLRGHPSNAIKPLSYREMEDEDYGRPFPYSQTKPEISFRVVIEPNR